MKQNKSDTMTRGIASPGTRWGALGAALLFLLLALPVLGQTPDYSGRPPSEVALDVGVAIPGGDLADDFLATETGFGAGEGLELGFRWRYHFSQSLSISPAFHFVDYKSFDSSTPEIGDYRIQSSTYRWDAELRLIAGNADTTFRPLVALSAGLYRNRVEGFYKGFEKPFDESVNTLGVGLRAGIQISAFEISGIYCYNRFSTWQFFRTGQDEDYDWDSIVVRVGWIVPFQ